jgi:hypothetical protein
MDASKIQLSAEEWQLVQNSALILTKHAVIDKVYHLFGDLAGQMQSMLQQRHRLPAEVLQLSPKISKGEQYQRMPWVVLDYPRFFSKTDVLAVRHFFWWGHYFSSTLHLKGHYQQLLCTGILHSILESRLKGYYWTVGGDEFNFDVSESYTEMDKIKPTQWKLKNAPFVKLTVIHPLEKWNEAPGRMLQAFEQFTHMAPG